MLWSGEKIIWVFGNWRRVVMFEETHLQFWLLSLFPWFLWSLKSCHHSLISFLMHQTLHLSPITQKSEFNHKSYFRTIGNIFNIALAKKKINYIYIVFFLLEIYLMNLYICNRGLLSCPVWSAISGSNNTPALFSQVGETQGHSPISCSL